MEDFRLEAAEQLPRCEQLLIELERAPKSAERLRELFRLIHTLKGNLGYVELNALMPLPQAIEDVLDALRCGAMTFDSLLGDILPVAAGVAAVVGVAVLTGGDDDGQTVTTPNDVPNSTVGGPFSPTAAPPNGPGN